MGAASTRPGPLCPAALGASPVPSPGVWGCLVTATGRGGHCAWLVLPPQEYHVLLWKRKTRTQPPAPAPCARLPCGSPAASVRVRVRLAPGCAPRSRAVTCALVALVWRRDHVLDYQVSPPRCMPLLAFREAWPTVSAGLLSVSAPAPPAGDAAAHQAVRSPGHSLPLPPRPGVSPEAPGQHLRPREPQHPPSPGASPPPKGWTHVTFLFLSGMFQAEATPTPCPSSPLSVGL